MAVENRRGKPVDKALRRSNGKVLRLIGVFLSTLFRMSTSPVDKPADSRVMKPRIA